MCRSVSEISGPLIFPNITVNFTIPTFNDSYPTDTNNTAPILPELVLVTSVNDWIVIQQRVDGSTNFRRSWLEYTNGFGTFNRNFWLGLERMHRITTSNVYRLRLEFLIVEGIWLSAEYDTFFLDDEEANYTLHVSGFSGDGGNWLSPNDPIRTLNGMQFSTFDMDHDSSLNVNCAAMFGGGGGFWFNACSWTRPNAVYGTPSFGVSMKNVSDWHQLSVSRMMVKTV